MGIVVSSVCSISYDVKIYNPIEGNVRVMPVDGEHGVFTGSVSEVDEIDTPKNSTVPNCNEKGATSCMMFAEGMSGSVLDNQITKASDGGQSAIPYSQTITTRTGAF